MVNETLFPFLAQKGHVVSLVGGGGKTTLLYAMAAYCACKGWRVLVMTTTHILQPPGGVWAQSDAERDSLWNRGQYVVAGTAAPGGKLTAPEKEQMERWMQLADIVLIEADGAKHMPCKAPAAHEPVLLPQSDIMLAVAGASALGRPIKEVCFRPELAEKLLGVSCAAVLTPELLAKLLANENGGRRSVCGRSFYAVLNQTDNPERLLSAKRTAEILQESYSVPCILTHFDQGERA